MRGGATRRCCRPRVALGLIGAIAVMLAATCPAVAFATRPDAQTAHGAVRNHARGQPGTYAIYKTFQNPYVAYALRLRRGRVAQAPQGPAEIVLRWGNKGFGYRHIKRNHGYTSTTESLITETVFKPQHVSHEPSAVVYTRTYIADSRLNGDVCTFKVVENPKDLDDGIEKGIITAYDNCDTFFL
jgi:hypothetical protein